MVNVNPTDKLVFDLEMFQIDFNEAKKEALKQEISEKYGVPVKNVEINFIPITIDDKGDKISLILLPIYKTRSFNNNCLKNILQQKVLKM